jgi:hypothetical protein
MRFSGTCLSNRETLIAGSVNSFASTLEPINYEIHFKLASLYMRMKRDQDAHKELEATFRTTFARKAPTPQTIASPQIAVTVPEGSAATTASSQPTAPAPLPAISRCHQGSGFRQ